PAAREAQCFASDPPNSQPGSSHARWLATRANQGPRRPLRQPGQRSTPGPEWRSTTAASARFASGGLQIAADASRVGRKPAAYRPQHPRDGIGPRDEGVDNRGIELFSLLIPDSAHSLLQGEAAAIRPVGRERIERVGNAQDPDAQRNRAGGQRVRIATPIPAFVVMPDARQAGLEEM